MLRSIMLLLAICAISGAAGLFEDLFDDGGAEGWTEYSTNPDSAHYYIDGGCYHMEIEDMDGRVSSFSGDDDTTTPWCMSIPDYTFYCKVMVWNPTSHVGFAGRMCSPLSSENGYMVWLRFTVNDVVLWRHDGPVSYCTLDTYAMPLDYGEYYWLRFDLTGGWLRAKVWQGSFWDEPSEYILEAMDYTYGDPGSVGMGCHSYGIVHNHVAFDSVLVCDPTSLEPTTWGCIKASF